MIKRLRRSKNLLRKQIFSDWFRGFPLTAAMLAKSISNRTGVFHSPSRLTVSWVHPPIGKNSFPGWVPDRDCGWDRIGVTFISPVCLVAFIFYELGFILSYTQVYWKDCWGYESYANSIRSVAPVWDPTRGTSPFLPSGRASFMTGMPGRYWGCREN